MMKTILCILLAVLLCAIASQATAQTVNDPNLRISELVSGLSQPTAMAFIGANDILVLQKADGRVRRVINGVLQPGQVLDVAVDSASERGLLGIALHPNFPTTPFVYLYFTESSTASDTTGAPSPLRNRVNRYTWNGAALASPILILDLPVLPGANHNGGTMTFGLDGKLYVVIGDLNHNGHLQNNSGGVPPDDTSVVFRINDDGTTPSDNPFSSQPDLARYYAYGVRNSFGLGIDPLTGELWNTENGPANYDEINLVKPGFNSGWNRIMGPDSRDPQNIADLVEFPGSHYADPKFSWFNTVGPTALVFLNSVQLGNEYLNDVFVGDINNGNLYRFKPNPTRDGFVFENPALADLVADDAGERQLVTFGTAFGGITDLKVGPDGLLYVLSFSGKIFVIARAPGFVPSDTPLVNLSTRGFVQTADGVLIGGFIVDGTAPKTVLIRGRGPSMAGAPFLVPDVLANPFLRLFSGQTAIGQNDNWQEAPACSGFICGSAGQISATGLDPCQANPGQAAAPPGCSLESAILITLNPGAYTVHLSGADGETGLGLVEVFDVDVAVASQLVNMSTRGFVQAGDNLLIGGFIVDGTAPKTVLIRGRGPSMAGAPFFVPDILANPFLRLFSGQTVIAQNDNWQEAPACSGFICSGAAQISATGLDPCQANPGQGAAPAGCVLEAAMLITLNPGAYTVHLTGADGANGVGLFEVFQLP